MKYGLVTLCILSLEIVIAYFVHDNFVRPFIGDVLVVILIYVFVQTFTKLPPSYAVIGVFVFALIIEFLQLFSLAQILGLEENKIAKIVLGSTFDPLDILAYLIGAWICLFTEFRRLDTRN